VLCLGIGCALCVVCVSCSFVCMFSVCVCGVFAVFVWCVFMSGFYVTVVCVCV